MHNKHNKMENTHKTPTRYCRFFINRPGCQADFGNARCGFEVGQTGKAPSEGNTWRALQNLTYFMWDETDVLDAARGTDVDDNVGWETNFSSTYKLNDNLSFTFAAAALFPDEDMEDVYGDNDSLYNLYFNVGYTF